MSPSPDYPVTPLPFTEVQLTCPFWSRRLETNRVVTLPYDFHKSESTGRIANFARAGGLEEGDHEGVFYNDSDVYKIMEGAAYCLALHPDKELEQYMDGLIAKVAAAQEEDGYLYTARTISEKQGETREDLRDALGEKRWDNVGLGHELYCMGHLMEAAVAHYQATRKDSLLEVAKKCAQVIGQAFHGNGRQDPPGHQEIELALVRLFRLTGEKGYLEQARFFLEARGREEAHALYGAYAQDHLPVTKQREMVGHAVRAVYMVAAMTDVAALLDDNEYAQAVDALWEEMVTEKLYLTGGIGARHDGEAFGEPFELPNLTAYNETCAAIALIFWNHRLFLMHKDARYLDLLERTLYNGFLAGVALTGDHFFYPNPLASDGKYGFNIGATGRQPWFETSCCPTNVVRFLPSLPGYVYGVDDEALFVNLYIASKARFNWQNTPISVSQEGNYPWEGQQRLFLHPAQPTRFTLKLRLPGWSRNEPAPGGLYCYLDEENEPVRILVNDEPAEWTAEKGFACIQREWQEGDVVDLDFPMAIRRVLCREEVQANRGRVALERGPLVYCLEAADHKDSVLEMVLPDTVHLTHFFEKDLLGGVEVIAGSGLIVESEDSGEAGKTREAPLKAIPYYAWNHRGPGEMAVWLVREPEKALPLEIPGENA